MKDGKSGASRTLMAVTVAALALGLAGATSATAGPPRLYPLAVKIFDDERFSFEGAEGAMRAPKRGCEANREVQLKYSASFGETSDWTVVATVRGDSGGFWEVHQPLAAGAYQAVVERKSTSNYRCKRGFSDIEELG